jgi:hypothetical protein
MPRGVPKSGFRKTARFLQQQDGPSYTERLLNVRTTPLEPLVEESDDEISTRLNERFEILNDLVNTTIFGDARALIVSGPPGLGKSHTVETILHAWDPNETGHSIVKGYVKATGLYKLLWKHRNKGSVIVFDDADSVFQDDVSLNMLKAVCDTNDIRRVSYLAEYDMIDEDTAQRIPRNFVFEGSVIFLSNLDFEELIDRGHRLAPHLQALVSRAHYIDLAMKTKKDYIIRIRQVIATGLLKKYGLTTQQEQDVIDFIEINKDRLRELSLRVALKIATYRKSDKPNWKATARVVTCRY